MLSIPHMIVVFLVVLVVFGPQKLPELARSFGKLMAEFRKASGDFKNAFEEEMRDLERQARIAELKKQAAEAVAAANAGNESGGRNRCSCGDAGVPGGARRCPTPIRLEQVTEAPVITPVAEAVPRLDVADGESVAAEAKQRIESSSENSNTERESRREDSGGIRPLS